MTFKEIELTLPNGFHDAYLTGVDFNILERTVVLSISVDVSPAGLSDRECRASRLTAFAVDFFFIEPPDGTYPYRLNSEGLSVSGDGALQGTDSKIEALISNLTEGTHCYRFFFDSWNAFMYIAARDVAFSWG